MISEKSDKIVEFSKEDLIKLTTKVICDLINANENQIDMSSLKSDIIKLINKNLKNNKL